MHRAILLASMAVCATAAGQMTIEESTRLVYAAWSMRPNPPTIDEHTYTDLGEWSAQARTALASASHTSTVSAEGVDLLASVSAGGGAGFSAAAACSVRLIFSIDRPMEWTLSYMFNPLPLGSNRHMLRREGAQENLFSVLHWYEGYQRPTVGAGFLDAGRYELWLSTDASQGVGTAEELHFAVHVPTPGAPLALASGWVLAARRRRRAHA